MKTATRLVTLGSLLAAIAFAGLSALLYVKLAAAESRLTAMQADVQALQAHVNKKPDLHKAVLQFLTNKNQRMALISNPDGHYSLHPEANDAATASRLDAASLAEVKQWQQKERQRLIQHTVGAVPPAVPLDATRELVARRKSYDLFHVSYATRYGQRTRAALALPRGAESAQRFPGVIAFRGTGGAGIGELKMFDQDEFARYNDEIFYENYTYPCLFAERGNDQPRYVVLAVDTTYAEPRPVGIENPHPKLRQLSAQKYLDALAALDYMHSLPEVDADRIACIGLCAGGAMCQRLAATDDRVKAVIVYGASLRIPDVDVNIGALIAPKRAIYGNGFYDFESLPYTLAAQLPEARKAYELYGAPGNLTYIVHPGEHNLNSEYCVAFLDEYFTAPPKRMSP